MLNLHTTYLFKGRVFTNCTGRMRIRITRRNLYQGGEKMTINSKDDFILASAGGFFPRGKSQLHKMTHPHFNFHYIFTSDKWGEKNNLFLPTNRSWGEGRKQYLLPLLSKIKSNLNFCFISNPIVQEAELSVS